MRERLITPEKYSEEDERQIVSLRPAKLSEYIGQKKIVSKLKVSINASLQRCISAEYRGKSITVSREFSLVASQKRWKIGVSKEMKPEGIGRCDHFVTKISKSRVLNHRKR